MAQPAIPVTPTATAGHRNRGLDGLRGIAILFVVASHARIPVIKFGGTTGVTLFFVLSGFLITTLLITERERTGTISLRRFYQRRALRLLPALLAALAGGTILAVAFGAPPGRTLTAAGMCLFYLGNLWPLVHIDPFPFNVLWSLALEEQYYLLWPLLLLAARRIKTPWVLGGVLAMALTSLVLRFTGDVTTLAGYDRAYYLPQSGAWAILAGAAVALYLHNRSAAKPVLIPPMWTWRVSVVGLILVSTVAGLRTGLYLDTSGITLLTILAAGPVAAVFAVILVAHCVTTRNLPTWLTHPVLLFFANISYALYLWEGIIDSVLKLEFGERGIMNLTVGLVSAVIAIGVATASTRWVEAPFLRRKDRLTNTNSAGITTGNMQRSA
jgi:peptidoglycan/LPS O-acetylase OafA/YrhL